ncbi:hypothetical protein Hanom_Chr16g01417121 [Helianthus anomalus]
MSTPNILSLVIECWGGGGVSLVMGVQSTTINAKCTRYSFITQYFNALYITRYTLSRVMEVDGAVFHE